jgi:radical SAM protein with 4Fe4S-binding SPASM domain
MTPSMVKRDGIPLFEQLCLESQSNCNRSCWFCPRTYDRTGKYLDPAGKSVIRAMPTEKILDVLDQARALGFRGLVGFHHYSEPLLDPRNVMLAREAQRRGLVPLDGVRLDFSAIGGRGGRAGTSMAIPRAVVPTDARMTVPDLTFRNGPCERPLIRMIIQWDGDVCNCCEDTSGAFELGNVYRSSLEDLWFSARHARIVKDLAAGRRDRYSLCRHCPLPPSGPLPKSARIEIAPRRYRSPIAQ